MQQKIRIAVTYEDGKVFQHFGHTERFKVYEVQDGRVQSASMLDTNGNGHGALANILKQNGVDALICGGIGGGAKQALAEAEIDLYGGVAGDADQAVADFIANKLIFNSDAQCGHRHDAGCGSQHDTGGHSCHDHCGSHTH